MVVLSILIKILKVTFVSVNKTQSWQEEMKIVEILLPDNYLCLEGGKPSISLPPISPTFDHSFFHTDTDRTYPNTRALVK